MDQPPTFPEAGESRSPRALRDEARRVERERRQLLAEELAAPYDGVVTLAILLAVLGSIGFASGATAQHRGVDKLVGESGDRAMGLKRVLQLLRTPVWLLGLFLILFVVSFVFQLLQA